MARNAWLIHRAKKSFAAGEDRKATLQAMRLVQIDKDYTPAATLLADIAEKNLSREALRWRMFAAKTDPSTEHQIALARTSIYFQEWEWADQALRAVKPKERQSVSYLQTAGAMALALRRYGEAEHFFAKALLADPNQPSLRLNLDITRLALNDPKIQEQAREDLRSLKKQPAFAQPAAYALLQDALATGKSLEPIARDLLALPSPSFSDRLAALTALAQVSAPDAGSLLADLQKSVADNPGEIYVLCNWMVRQGKAVEAKQWLDSLAPEKLKTTPVPMAYAECLLSLKDWKALADRLSREKWADSEVLRHAFLLRAKREMSPASRSETGLSDWKQALRGESVRPGELYLAANLFWSWGWKTEAEDLWWTIAAQTTNPEMALRTLDQIFRAEKNTGKLWWVSQRAHQTNPRDKVSQNNYAMLSLLLNLDLKNAHTLAESLYRGQPENPAFLSTYAFSLYRRGQTKEALRLFSTLDPKLLEDPAYAFYYALFLKAEGKESESVRYAKLAEKANLLPEEKALME